MTKKTNKKLFGGFTLIETIIYISLFSIIMTGVLISVYTLISSNSKNMTQAMVVEEGIFLLGKIDWVLNGVENINLPITSDNTLSVTKSHSTIIIKVSGGIMSIKKGSNQSLDLNNSNVRVVCPESKCFTHKLESSEGLNPESVAVNFTIETRTPEGQIYSQDFYTKKYLRK